MRTIILPCLMVLLDWPGATLRDLRRFMDDTRNRDLVDFAQTRHHYEDVPDFFTHDFHSKHYKDTKNAVQTKLQSLFASGKFSRLTCGPRPSCLRKPSRSGRSWSSISPRGAWRAGRLGIWASDRGHSSKALPCRRDKQKKRVPTRVISDEFHNFTTRSMEKIITQAAKYKLTFSWRNSRSAKARRRRYAKRS